MAVRAKAPKADADWVPHTKYQQWLHSAMRIKGLEIADLGRAIDKDYNYAYKIVRGQPGKNNTLERPGYEMAFKIGEAVGDVHGSLTAADYPIPTASFVREGITIDVFVAGKDITALTLTEEDIAHLLLTAELRQRSGKR